MRTIKLRARNNNTPDGHAADAKDWNTWEGKDFYWREDHEIHPIFDKKIIEQLHDPIVGVDTFDTIL